MGTAVGVGWGEGKERHLPQLARCRRQHLGLHNPKIYSLDIGCKSFENWHSIPGSTY